MKLSSSNNIEKENNNWNLAILTFVILILLFFWFYKFLFIVDPTKLNKISNNNISTSEINL